MSTFTQILYHIVFATKAQQRALRPERREELLKYIWGILKNKNCHLYRINAVEDHVHILCGLHPSVSLADLVKTIKVSTSMWIKEERLFPEFEGWQEGYSAFTIGFLERNGVIAYIKGQQEHHRHKTFKEEMVHLLEKAGIKYEERYLE